MCHANPVPSRVRRGLPTALLIAALAAAPAARADAPAGPPAPPRGLAGHPPEAPPAAGPRVSPDGAAFADFPDVQVNQDLGNLIDEFGPAIAVEPSGVVHVVWNGDETQKSVWYARSTDGGQTFSQALRLNDPVAYPPSFSVYQPDVAVGADGAVYVTWFDYRAWTSDTDFGARIDVYLDRSADGGTTWGTDVLASPGGSGTYPWHFQPHLALDRLTGNLYVSFTDYDRFQPEGDPSDVSVTRSVDGGASFEPKVRVDDLPGSTHVAQAFSSIAVGPDGDVYVAFEDERGARTDIRLARSSDAGLGFGPSLPVNADTTGVQQQPSLAVDRFGNLHAVWLDWSQDPDPYTPPFDDHVAYARAPAGGGAFGAAVQVTDAPMNGDLGFDFPPRVAVDRLGLVHVVWHDRRTGTSFCYVDRSADGGQSFGTDGLLASNLDLVTHAIPRLAIGADDDPCVTWVDRRMGNGRFDVFFARRRAITAAPGGPLDRLPALAAYPNPSNGVTTVRLVLDREGPLRVEIRDLLGRRVRTLAEGSRAGGEHLVRWDGSDDSGRPLPAGAYWVRVDAGAGARQRLTVLLR
jgi:hypothetical protein